MLVRDAARQEAKRALDKHWDGSFPVNPFAIAEKMGIEVEITTLRDDISGAIIVEGGDAVILVEEGHSIARQSFTCAHELGHYFERSSNGDEEFSFVEKRSAKYDLHEYYADEFAANLLMPAGAFEEAVRAFDSNRRVAAMFAVSVAAVEKRREKLKI